MRKTGLAHLPEGRAEAGYAVAPSARGRGIAASALQALTAFAWTIPELHRIELYIEPVNSASLRTAAGASYNEEGLLVSELRAAELMEGPRAEAAA